MPYHLQIPDGQKWPVVHLVGGSWTGHARSTSGGFV